jgi:hypothetical protein
MEMGTAETHFLVRHGLTLFLLVQHFVRCHLSFHKRTVSESDLEFKGGIRQTFCNCWDLPRLDKRCYLFSGYSASSYVGLARWSLKISSHWQTRYKYALSSLKALRVLTSHIPRYSNHQRDRPWGNKFPGHHETCYRSTARKAYVHLR